MDLEVHMEDVRRQMAAAAEAGGEEAQAIAGRLMAPLDAAIRLALLDVLAAAAEEITCELAPGSVELRLRGRDPEFVVTPPPPDRPVGSTDPDDGSWPAPTLAGATPLRPLDGEEGGMSRINLRLPDLLKARVEQAAAREGLSSNAWLVRVVGSALERPAAAPGGERRPPSSGQHFKGWAR